MSQAQRNELESVTAPAPDVRTIPQLASLGSCDLRDVRDLKSGINPKSAALPDAHFGERGELFFCSEPVKEAKDNKPKETYEQQLDKRIEKAFGADVLANIKDWNWLIKNQDKLKDGFKDLKDDDAWEMARRLRTLSTVEGKPPIIFITKADSKSAGNLIPKTHYVWLRREFWSDDKLGQFSH